MLILFAIAVVLLSTVLLLLFINSVKRPPGPKGNWLLGALSMVASDPNTTHLVFHSWYEVLFLITSNRLNRCLGTKNMAIL